MLKFRKDMLISADLKSKLHRKYAVLEWAKKIHEDI
jgi:hypothetical protein